MAALAGACAAPEESAAAQQQPCEFPKAPAPATSADLRVFAYDTAADPRVTLGPARSERGVAVHDIQYDSPKGGHVTGLLFVPPGTGPFAGVIVQHGMPSNAAGIAGVAARIAAHGAVALAIDAPFARRGGGPVHFAATDSAEQVQLMVDLQRGVDILRARQDVDRRRIAYHGISFGGAMGALFIAIEKRLATAILTVPDGGLVAHFTGPEDQRNPLYSRACRDQVAWLRAMHPIEPSRFIHLAAPTPLLVQSGRQDELVPPRDAASLHARVPTGTTVKWYDAGHGLTADAVRDQLEWLHRYVGTAAPRA